MLRRDAGSTSGESTTSRASRALVSEIVQSEAFAPSQRRTASGIPRSVAPVRRRDRPEPRTRRRSRRRARPTTGAPAEAARLASAFDAGGARRRRRWPSSARLLRSRETGELYAASAAFARVRARVPAPSAASGAVTRGLTCQPSCRNCHVFGRRDGALIRAYGMDSLVRASLLVRRIARIGIRARADVRARGLRRLRRRSDRAARRAAGRSPRRLGAPPRQAPAREAPPHGRREVPPRLRARRAARGRARRRAPPLTTARSRAASRRPPTSSSRSSRRSGVPAPGLAVVAWVVALDAAIRHKTLGETSWEALATQAGFAFAFALLNLLLLRAEVARIRLTARARVERELERLRDDARSYRLLGAGEATAQKEDAEERLARSSVEEIHQSVHYALELLRRCLDLHTAVLLWRTDSGTHLRISELSTALRRDPRRAVLDRRRRARRRRSRRRRRSCSREPPPVVQGAVLRGRLPGARARRDPRHRRRHRARRPRARPHREPRVHARTSTSSSRRRRATASAPSRTSASSCSSSARRSSKASSTAPRRRSAPRSREKDVVEAGVRAAREIASFELAAVTIWDEAGEDARGLRRAQRGRRDRGPRRAALQAEHRPRLDGRHEPLPASVQRRVRPGAPGRPLEATALAEYSLAARASAPPSRTAARHAHPRREAAPRVRRHRASHARGPREPPRGQPLQRAHGREARDDGDHRRPHRSAQQARDARSGRGEGGRGARASVASSRCSSPTSTSSRRSTTPTATTSATSSSRASPTSSRSRSARPTSSRASAAKSSSSSASRPTRRGAVLLGERIREELEKTVFNTADRTAHGDLLGRHRDVPRGRRDLGRALQGAPTRRSTSRSAPAATASRRGPRYRSRASKPADSARSGLEAGGVARDPGQPDRAWSSSSHHERREAEAGRRSRSRASAFSSARRRARSRSCRPTRSRAR